MLSNALQRSDGKGRQVWLPADGREIVRRGDLDTAPSKDVLAIKSFVRIHHYAKTTGSILDSYDLRLNGERVGIAVFGLCARAYRPPFGQPAYWRTLGRFVLDERIGANGETLFLGECFADLRKKGLDGIVSFADPVPRTTAAGEVIFPGHAGIIYRAHNATFTGRSKSETKWLLPDGTIFETRTANKIKTGDIGRDYAERTLVAHGATPIQPGEDPAEWVTRWRQHICRPFLHKGNLRYLWALDKRARKHLPAGLPYPKFRAGVGLLS